MSDIYAGFDEVIYEDAWQYLTEHAPRIADEVKRVIDRGGTPEALRRRWLTKAGANRVDLATRIENAALYLVVEKQRE